MKKILNFIFSIILAVCIIGISIIYICLNTFLSEKYMLNILEKEDYINNTYWMVKANFENYIYQSGLDENVLEDIIKKDKVKDDIEIIVSNIYNGQNNEIDTTQISENLYSNIEKSLGDRKLNSNQKEAVNDFVNQICEEYKSTISFYKTDAKAGTAVGKTLETVDFAKIVLLVFIGIDFLILLVLNLNRIYKFVSWLGVSFATNGFIMLFINFFIRARIKIRIITIINDFISEVLRKIIFNILNIITIYGVITLVIGIIMIIYANTIQNKQMKKLK